jgi:uncharacterized protein
MAMSYPEPERLPEQPADSEPMQDEPAPGDPTFIGQSPFSELVEEPASDDATFIGQSPFSEQVPDPAATDPTSMGQSPFNEPVEEPGSGDPTVIGQSPFSEPVAEPGPTDPAFMGQSPFSEPVDEPAAAEPPPYTPPPSQSGPTAGPPPGGTPPPYAAPAPLSPAEERTWAMLAHLSTLVNLFTGFLGPVAALVIYLIYKDRSRFVGFHAMQSFVFQLVFYIGAGVLAGVLWAAGGILSVVLIGLCIFPFALLVSLIPLVAIIYGVVGAIQTYQGQPFEYWMVANWVRNI